MDQQFKRGVLALCVLSLLEKSDRYGYELVTVISQNIEITEGSVYPLLKKLKDEGYVTTYLAESVGGPPRKYYTLTEQGKVRVSWLRREWQAFVDHVDVIIKGGDRS